jgi:hypothetical protein
MKAYNSLLRIQMEVNGQLHTPGAPPPPPKEQPLPIGQVAGQTPEQARTWRRREIFPAPAGTRTEVFKLVFHLVPDLEYESDYKQIY